MTEQRAWQWPDGLFPTELFEALAAYAPRLLGGLLLILAGWLLAQLLRAAVVRVSRGAVRLLPTRWRSPGGGGVPRVLGIVTYWVVLLSFIAAATSVWGMTVVADWLDRILAHLPLLAAALLALAVGFYLGQLARDATQHAAAHLPYRNLLAIAAQVSVWALALVIALDLAGLDITFLVVLAAIIVGAAAGGTALAFGLGARPLVYDLLSVRELRARYRIGDAVRLGEVEGRVVQMTARTVVIETDEGQVGVPGRLFNEQPCVLLVKESRDD
jgi:small-conductance mechanosensitive channel